MDWDPRAIPVIGPTPLARDYILTFLVIGLVIFINTPAGSALSPELGLFVVSPILFGGIAYWFWCSFMAMVFIKQNASTISYMRIALILFTNMFFWVTLFWLIKDPGRLLSDFVWPMR